MANTTDNSELARAREWLDMARPKWRLQTMQHRSRYNPRTGEYRQLPTRIRRFLNGTPVGMKSLVLEILKESAPYRSPVFDCEADEDLLYRPTNTFIRKDGPEHATNGKDPTYTIIQDLLLDDGRDDAFGFGDESSCAQAGETEYHWDEPSVMDCPDGGQGVSYQITDISRDRDTDLFSYRVRKVRTLTTHAPPRTEGCDRRKTVTVESWDGVYGEPGAFRQDPVRGGSAPVALPDPCAQADGTTVRIDVQRNPDCTYRVSVQTTTAKVDDGEDGSGAAYSAYRDRYKSERSERILNQHSRLPKEGVEQHGGVTVKYTSERNEDGTWNNTTDTQAERPVRSSTQEVRVTPRGTLRTRIDTNVDEPASGISTAYGSYKTVKTPGGLYTNEYTEYVRDRAENLGLVCKDTAFLKTHETQTGADAMPQTAYGPGGEVTGPHVPAATGGRVTTWTYDVDAEGFVTRRVRTDTEHTVENAVVSRTAGWLGTATTRTHRSLQRGSQRLQSLANVFNNPPRGTTVELRVTDGDCIDAEERTFTRAGGVAIGRECSTTVYQHVVESTDSADSLPASDQNGFHAGDAGNGRTHQRTYSLDPSTGAVTRRDRTVTELERTTSRKSVRVTARGTETRTSNSNAANAPAMPTAREIGKAVEFEVTPGGRYNTTTTTFAANPGDTGRGCERDRFLHTDTATAMAAAAPASHVEGGAGGLYRERTARLGDDGLWEVATATHEEQTVTGEVHVSVTSRARRTTTITRQTEGTGETPPATPEGAGRELRRTATRGGRWTLEETTVEALSGEVSHDCADDLFLHRHATGTTAGSATAGDVGPAGGGYYRERSQRLGDDGVWSVVNTVNQERQVPQQRVDERVTRHGLVVRVTDMQVPSPGQALTANAGNVGRERAVEKTRGGLYNVSTTTVSPLSGSTDERCEKTAFLHTHSTTSMLRSKSLSHVDAASNGEYGSETWSLTELGAWERQKTENTEEQPNLRIRQYKDAFGETKVTEEFSHASENGGRGGKLFTAESLVQSVESTLTNGRRYNVRTQEEKPSEVDSGWLHFEKTTDKGLAVYHDFIVFRNATLSQVNSWINHIKSLNYSGGFGSYANHPSISISPNKFKLWDGTIALVTTYTPKAWSAGGSTTEDNWEHEVDVLSVNFVPLSSSKLLKIITKETHKKGGGVGKDKLKNLLGSGVIKGSQFAFHPGGQAFSYDLITKVETNGVVTDMPRNSLAAIWDGTMTK